MEKSPSSSRPRLIRRSFSIEYSSSSPLSEKGIWAAMSFWKRQRDDRRLVALTYASFGGFVEREKEREGFSSSFAFLTAVNNCLWSLSRCGGCSCASLPQKKTFWQLELLTVCCNCMRYIVYIRLVYCPRGCVRFENSENNVNMVWAMIERSQLAQP